MEVHPPHEPVHSWREALIHIGLMTVGLFIALMLEGLVEYVHHKHLVREARENIRVELEHNHENAQKDIGYLGQSGDKIKAGITTIRYMQAHPAAKGQHISFTVEFADLNDAAWRTARDTGALGYMPLEEVQRYASLYGMQESVSSSITQLLKQQAEALAPVFAEESGFSGMTNEEFATMRHAGERNYADIVVLQQLLRELDQQYVGTLKQA